MYALPEHFQAKSRHLATRKMRPNKHSIFKPSRVTWRLGKCDQANTLFSSQVASLGGAEDAPSWRRRRGNPQLTLPRWIMRPKARLHPSQPESVHTASYNRGWQIHFQKKFLLHGNSTCCVFYVEKNEIKTIDQARPLDQRLLNSMPPAASAQRLPFAPSAYLPTPASDAGREYQSPAHQSAA